MLTAVSLPLRPLMQLYSTRFDLVTAWIINFEIQYHNEKTIQTKACRYFWTQKIILFETTLKNIY